MDVLKGMWLIVFGIGLYFVVSENIEAYKTRQLTESVKKVLATETAKNIDDFIRRNK